MSSRQDPAEPVLHEDPAAVGRLHRDVSDESVGGLISEVATDLSRLLRQELALARAEIREEAVTAGKAGAMLGGSGLAGWMAALFGSLAIVWGLGEWMHLGWAALIVTAAWAVLGAVLFVVGRNRLRQVDPVPEQTVHSLKEDKEWITGQKS
jgi:hypothetical protein